MLNKYQKKTKKKPEFLWAGALSDLRAQYTSVELQHEISKLRTEVTQKSHSERSEES
ncbi:MAG: DUF2281 domain-containing protein [Bacteroidota bacterium]|nr:DUF2281 domain-containing protein [Bacteroidota bacterium]